MDEQTRTNERPAAGEHVRLDLARTVSILLSHRLFLTRIFLLAAVVSVVVSLLLPVWYRASTSILPPKDAGGLGSLAGAGSLLRNVTSLTRSSAGLLGGSGTYNYLAILKSRTSLETIARQFDLPTVYDISEGSMEKTLEALSGNVSFEIKDEGNLIIDVFDQDPDRAAAMANAFVDVLNDVSLRLATQEARSNREFIERRVDSTRAQLRDAEDRLKEFQEKTGLLVSMDETASGLGAIAELYAMRARKDIERSILEKSVPEDNERLVRARLELSELDRRLAGIPAAGVEAIRRFRDVLIQQKILEFTLPLLEQAKVDENKDVPVILILDKASVPERKAKPKRSLIVLGTTFLTMLAAAGFVLVRESYRARAGDGGLSETVGGAPVTVRGIFFGPRAED